MKTGILFDLDGTLLDTLADLAGSVNHVLASFGYPQRTVEEVRQFVGNGAARLIAQAVPEGANPAPVLAAFQPYYSAHCQIKTKPYEGIPEALAALRERYPTFKCRYGKIGLSEFRNNCRLISYRRGRRRNASKIA